MCDLLSSLAGTAENGEMEAVVKSFEAMGVKQKNSINDACTVFQILFIGRKRLLRYFFVLLKASFVEVLNIRYIGQRKSACNQKNKVH
jgi:hypothetical protein